VTGYVYRGAKHDDLDDLETVNAAILAERGGDPRRTVVPVFEWGHMMRPLAPRIRTDQKEDARETSAPSAQSGH
jgi:hypothetical protein